MNRPCICVSRHETARTSRYSQSRRTRSISSRCTRVSASIAQRHVSVFPRIARRKERQIQSSHSCWLWQVFRFAISPPSSRQVRVALLDTRASSARSRTNRHRNAILEQLRWLRAYIRQGWLQGGIVALRSSGSNRSRYPNLDLQGQNTRSCPQRLEAKVDRNAETELPTVDGSYKEWLARHG